MGVRLILRYVENVVADGVYVLQVSINFDGAGVRVSSVIKPI